MSRDTKMKDTKIVLTGENSELDFEKFCTSGSEGCIPRTRDCIKYYSDEGCLEACEFLYDLNIQTYTSSANVDGKENSTKDAWIGIVYDSLSDENKSIVSQMQESGIIGEIDDASKYRSGDYRTFKLSFPVCSDDLVGDVSDKFMMLVKQFVPQDVLYGRTSETKIRNSYPRLEDGTYYDCWTSGTLTQPELDERVKEEQKDYYDDGNGNLFYTEELLRKHIKYIEGLKPKKQR